MTEDLLQRFRLHRVRRDTEGLISLCGSLLHKERLRVEALRGNAQLGGEVRRAAVRGRNERIQRTARLLRQTGWSERDLPGELADRFGLSQRQITRIIR